jgi:hypothetical protein
MRTFQLTSARRSGFTAKLTLETAARMLEGQKVMVMFGTGPALYDFYKRLTQVLENSLVQVEHNRAEKTIKVVESGGLCQCQLIYFHPTSRTWSWGPSWKQIEVLQDNSMARWLYDT